MERKEREKSGFITIPSTSYRLKANPECYMLEEFLKEEWVACGKYFNSLESAVKNISVMVAKDKIKGKEVDLKFYLETIRDIQQEITNTFKGM